MSKLNKIKYDGLYIRRMNVPDTYVAYTYNDSMTVTENIYALWNELKKVNIYLGEVVDLVNAMVEFLNGEGLKSHVTEKLEEWLEDGTLEELINDALFNSKADKVWVEEQINLINQSLGDTKTYVDEEIIKNKDYVDGEVLKNKNYVDDEVLKNKEYLDSEVNQINKMTKGVYNLIYGDGEGINFLHRGLSQFAPENSFWAFDMAAYNNARGVELDVVVSKDGGFIVSHDDTLISMTNNNGLISEMNEVDIKKIMVTKGKNVNLYPEVSMRTLEDVLYISKRAKMRMIIEMKFEWTDQDIINVIALIDKYNYRNMVALMSFDLDTLKRIRAIDKEFNIGYIVWNFNQQTVDDILDLGNCFGSINYVNMTSTRQSVNLANLNNIPVTYWTVNDIPTYFDMLKNGCLSITSDHIKGSRPVPVTKSFTIAVNDGVPKFDDRFSPEPVSIHVSADNKIITLNLAIPFGVNAPLDDWSSTQRGQAQAQVYGTPDDGNYITTAGEKATNVVLRYKNKEGVTIPITNVDTFFNVQFTGFDFMP